MPQHKDLKRIVRARMKKTGESYTAARLQIGRKKEPSVDYAALAAMSDATIKKNTGRSWSEWIALLDAEKSAGKPHREIARYVSSLGIPDWWAQGVTVGYERIKGLREKTQRRGGGYEASKSRTYAVPVEQLFEAFANARRRKRWLPEKITVRSASANKAMRLALADGTVVLLGFYSKSPAKSSVAVQHTGLADRSAVANSKAFWSERLDALAGIIA